MDKLLYIQTGGYNIHHDSKINVFNGTPGTIDKVYPSRAGAYGFVIEDAAVLKFIPKNILSYVKIVSVCKKDSQDIDGRDRERMFEAIVEHEGFLVLITHGTDTMIETGNYLWQKLKQHKKCVVITGATQHWCIRSTDAELNVGVALGLLAVAAKTDMMESSVHIAMNGQIIPTEKACRDPTGLFYCTD